MSLQEELSGVIDRFIFQSIDTAFSVFILTLPNKKTITVTGTIVNIHEGQQVNLQGIWIRHPKYGRQFEVQQCTASIPTSIIGLKKYLASGLIKGIGPIYATKLVNHFGTSVLDIIEHNPERLSEVLGIGPKRIATISTAWKSQKEIAEIMIFLQERDISPVFATKIFKQYGKESIAVVQENPYRLAEDIWGIGFKTADQLAQKLGFTHDSTKRIRAGIQYAIQNATNNGHLYLEINELKKHICNLLSLELNTHATVLKTALHELYEQNTIKLITYNEHHFITLSKFYFSEKGVASLLQKLISHPSPYTFDFDSICHSISQKSDTNTVLNEKQQKGILTTLQYKVTIITGGPGTGKTTLIKKLLYILDAAQLTYKLAAPTGRAAKRITEGTGKHALTIHRLLEFDPATMSFKHNKQRVLKLDFLIIDEASMIDVFIAHALLKAIPHNAHVVFIGDIDQLPSVGAGNVLGDMIASGAIPSIQLQHIFRQTQDSLIIVNAHRINNGKFPLSQVPDTKKDYIFIKEQHAENLPEHLYTIFQRILPSHHISINDAIILTPMNRGLAGTQKINDDLQILLNPQPKPSIMRRGTLFKVGDRVMQIRNNYDKLVFNGDMGIIEEIDPEEHSMIVRFQKLQLTYENSELDELVLAYAISVHKSQGSEYAAAIIPIFMQHFILLQRNLLYTAITRAKHLCIVIGEPRALAIAINNNKSITRTTFLPQFLTSDLESR